MMTGGELAVEAELALPVSLELAHLQRAYTQFCFSALCPTAACDWGMGGQVSRVEYLLPPTSAMFSNAAFASGCLSDS